MPERSSQQRPVVLAALAVLCGAPIVTAQQLAPPSTGGVAAIERALSHAATSKRVLIIAAHPDDENNELLTLLSRGFGVDAAYLSLSRGEGGQNLIGTELGEGLGLVRSGELLAARSIDGARQFFTRDFDFGFSKSLEETDRFWPRDTSLADAARIVRRFRPQVIVAVFSGTPRDGHGQHQQSAVVAQQVFELFRDSSWGPKRLYRSAFFDTSATTHRMASGMLDPVEGKSYVQLAVLSRSQHRSQDMGGIQRLGPGQVRLQLMATAERGPIAPGTHPVDDGLFGGTDTMLAPGLQRYRALVDSARAVLGPRSLGRVQALLAGALGELRRNASPEFLAGKEPMVEEALAAAAGIVVDPAADDGFVVPGQALQVALSIWSAGGAVARVGDVTMETPAGWTIGPGRAPEPPGGFSPISAAGPADGFEVRRFALTPPADAPITEPYFLQRPRAGAQYDWSTAPDSLRGEAFDPPLLMARVTLDLGGTRIMLRREVSWRYADQARGEIRRPIFVVPAVGVAVSPDLVVWPVQSGGARTLTVELTHGARGTTSGDVRLELPGDWPEVAPQRFTLVGEGTKRSFTFEVRAPPRLVAGAYEVHAVATAGGLRYERATQLVDYPHIRPVQYATSATVHVEATALALPQLHHVGYVRGAADMMPEALAGVGVPVAVLSSHDLERADLSQYDVIVVGSRAYETDPALIANNARLLDYARAGGRVIVQYQQYQFVQGNFAPFPITMERPHDRVTEENSPVRLLQPGHPLFQTPNPIGEADWSGWIQERGLYFAHTWDPAYTPLLEMGDSGERQQGGMLVARLGRGLYVYTGLAFFRELPAGVPGAYRLFVNLLGLEPANVP
jgi:LmbE family N-acetylglucosaminyl deacetylase